MPYYFVVGLVVKYLENELRNEQQKIVLKDIKIRQIQIRYRTLR